MNKLLVACCILFVFLLCDKRQLKSADNVEWKNQFLNEAPVKWDQYKTFTKSLQGTVDIAFYPRSGSGFTRKATETSRLYFKQRNGCVLFQRETLSQNGRKLGSADLLVVNPKYAFALYKKKHNQKWIITAVDTNLDNGLSMLSPIVQVSEILSFPYRFQSINPLFPELITDASGCKIEDAVLTKHKNAEHVKVAFTFSQLIKKNPNMTLKVVGNVNYDPKHAWLMQSAEMMWNVFQPGSPKNNVTFTRYYEYNTDDAKFPLPIHVTTETVNRAVNTGSKVDYKFRLHVGDPSPDEFTLSAFGFPEPFETNGKPIPWFLWAAGAGVVCLVAGGAWAWHRSRRSM